MCCPIEWERVRGNKMILHVDWLRFAAEMLQFVDDFTSCYDKTLFSHPIFAKTNLTLKKLHLG